MDAALNAMERAKFQLRTAIVKRPVYELDRLGKSARCVGQPDFSVAACTRHVVSV